MTAFPDRIGTLAIGGSPIQPINPLTGPSSPDPWLEFRIIRGALFTFS